jgi:hypothetical protein
MDKDFLGGARMDDHTGGIGLDPKTDNVAANTLGDLRQLRISKRESQEKFWGRFGVTQSSGSRFETGLSVPAPVAILLRLYVNGKLSDGDLPD